MYTSTSGSNPFNFNYSSFIVIDEDLITKLEIKQVIFRDQTTIVLWSDGTRTVVNCVNEIFDEEKGIAMCVVKKALRNYTKFDEALENAVYDNTVSRKERKELELKELQDIVKYKGKGDE